MKLKSFFSLFVVIGISNVQAQHECSVLKYKNLIKEEVQQYVERQIEATGIHGCAQASCQPEVHFLEADELICTHNCKRFQNSRWHGSYRGPKLQLELHLLLDRQTIALTKAQIASTDGRDEMIGLGENLDRGLVMTQLGWLEWDRIWDDFVTHPKFQISAELNQGLCEFQLHLMGNVNTEDHHHFIHFGLGMRGGEGLMFPLDLNFNELHDHLKFSYR